MESTKLILVRHGATDLNRDRRFRGVSDAPLNDDGRAEAAGAGTLVAPMLPFAIHTSPMPRALETAEIISDVTGAPVVTDVGLTDIDYGEWQGLTVEEVAARFGDESLEKWKNDPGAFRFPGGESMTEVRSRLGPVLLRLAREYTGRPVVAVTHLAVLKVCFIALLDLDPAYFWRVAVDNGSVSVFDYTPTSGYTMESWNITPATTR